MRALGSLAVLLISLPAAALPAFAFSFDGDVHTTVNVGDRYYWSGIYLTSSQKLAYSVQVLEGSSVNVSLIDDRDLEASNAGLRVDRYQSASYTLKAAREFRGNGMYALVIVKTAAGNCSCKVDIGRTTLPVWQDPFFQCVAGAVIFAVMSVAVLLKVRNLMKAARLAATVPPAPPAPYMPPPGYPPAPVPPGALPGPPPGPPAPAGPGAPPGSGPAGPPPYRPAPAPPPGYPAPVPQAPSTLPAVSQPRSLDVAPQPPGTARSCKYCGMEMAPGEPLCPRCLGDQNL